MPPHSLVCNVFSSHNDYVAVINKERIHTLHTVPCKSHKSPKISKDPSFQTDEKTPKRNTSEVRSAPKWCCPQSSSEITPYMKDLQISKSNFEMYWFELEIRHNTNFQLDCHLKYKKKQLPAFRGSVNLYTLCFFLSSVLLEMLFYQHKLARNKIAASILPLTTKVPSIRKDKASYSDKKTFYLVWLFLCTGQLYLMISSFFSILRSVLKYMSILLILAIALTIMVSVGCAYLMFCEITSQMYSK